MDHKAKATKRGRRGGNNNDLDENGNGDDHSDSNKSKGREGDDFFKVRKVPRTSPKLYKNLIVWCLEWGCLMDYLELNYLLDLKSHVCHANDLEKMQFSHMSSTIFDALSMHFHHMKPQ
jgi:hypothetical protein